jgi:hypothetical protein
MGHRKVLCLPRQTQEGIANQGPEMAMNYLRISVFSLLVLIALLLPGLILAMMLGWNPLLFGRTPEEVGASFRLIEHLATGAAVGLVYAWLLWPVTKKILAHAAIVFLVAESFQSMAGLVLGGTIADAFVWQAFLIDAFYAATGVLLVFAWRSIRSCNAR